ncbi:integral membrane protein [Ligilactobacillus ceti DSM 22408]|uniref:Integral membrane protein n=2 Tax=Ligilactobacillus TaxID=2767887 RepID=A0A0R2KTC7_9LACO|nr:integral membrane protein [Ligilactobacillus ceti DSM 22408]
MEETHLQEKFSKAPKTEKGSRQLRERMMALNDGIIAIIITIMILEVPVPSGDVASYIRFIKAVAIFLVSFFIVANFWYELSRLYSLVQVATKKMMIVNFIFLAALSMMPIITKWLMNYHNRLAVINYGVIYMILDLLEMVLFYLLIRDFIECSSWMKNHLYKVTRLRMIVLLIVSAILILLSYYFPRVMIYAYLALPIIDFVFPDRITHLLERDSFKEMKEDV